MIIPPSRPLHDSRQQRARCICRISHVKEAFLLLVRLRASVFEGTASPGNAAYVCKSDGRFHETAVEVHTISTLGASVTKRQSHAMPTRSTFSTGNSLCAAGYARLVDSSHPLASSWQLLLCDAPRDEGWQNGRIWAVHGSRQMTYGLSTQTPEQGSERATDPNDAAMAPIHSTFRAEDARCRVLLCNLSVLTSSARC